MPCHRHAIPHSGSFAHYTHNRTRTRIADVVCVSCACGVRVCLQIFSIVEALLAVNQELLKNLEQRYKHWSQRQTIGDVFLQMVRAGSHFSRGPVDMPSQELSCAVCAVCAVKKKTESTFEGLQRVLP